MELLAAKHRGVPNEVAISRCVTRAQETAEGQPEGAVPPNRPAVPTPHDLPPAAPGRQTAEEASLVVAGGVARAEHCGACEGMAG